ncbi:MAG: tetratricopeptide repeat protein [Candidatus Adiutrix sp.]
MLLATYELAAQSQADMDDREVPGGTPIALVEEAYLANRRGDYTAAIEGYTKIIQRRGLTRRERAISYLLRGEAKRDDGQLEEAIFDFTRALRQWPGYPHAHFFRGRTYEQQGNLIEAYADMAQALELDPLRESYSTHLALLKRRMTESGVEIPPEITPNPSLTNLPEE